MTTVSLWLVLIDALRPGGNPTNWRTFGGLGLGLAGIALLVRPDSTQVNGGRLDIIGVAAVLLASLSWAIGSVYGRGAELPKSPLMGTAAEMLAGSAGLFLAGTVKGEWRRMESDSWQTGA